MTETISIIYAELNKKLHVAKTITEQYQWALDNFSDTHGPLAAGISSLIGNAYDNQALFGQFEAEAVYAPASREKIFIDSTEFASFPGDNVFEWKTRVRFVRLFQKRPTKYGELTGYKFPYDIMEETVRIQPFDVSWTSKVDAGAKFSEFAIGDIVMAEQTTEIATLAKFSYGLEEYAIVT